VTGSKVPLPSGGWLELRDPEDVTERQRRSVANVLGRLSPDMKRMLSSGKPQEADTLAEAGLEVVLAANETDMDTFDALNDALAAALIVSWSYELPVTADAMADLPSRDYRAVQVAVAPYIGDFMGLNTDPSPDPDSPT